MPPFADRIVRADPVTASLGLRLHDYFIARSIARLRPGGLALFVTSTGTMDKVNTAAREHIAGMADLVGAVRLPECSMRASAGTDVVIDVLVFQRRGEGVEPSRTRWIDLADVDLPSKGDAMAEGEGETDPPEALGETAATPGPRKWAINEDFAAHPEMVLGIHAIKRGVYGPEPTYTCRARPGAAPLQDLLKSAMDRLPAGIFVPSPVSLATDDALEDEDIRPGTAADGASIKEGSYFVGKAGRLMQIVNGSPEPVAIREGKGAQGSGGITPKAAKIIRALLPIRDRHCQLNRTRLTLGGRRGA